MATLNIETFNEILFQAVKPEGRIPLLENELTMAYQLKVEKMEELVDQLNASLPYHEKLNEINNIDSSLNKINDMLIAERAKQPAETVADSK